jgi:hypothetical protein
MSTSYSAKTETVDGTSYFQVDDMHENDVPRCRVNLEIYNSLPPFRQQTILPSTYMRSRGAWAMEMADRVCRLAKIDGLPFLAGIRAPALKIIPILADGEDEESGSTCIVNYGFLLDEPVIQKANLDIARVFEWSSANIDILADENLMGYHAYKDGIREAIQSPIASNHLTASSDSGSKIPGHEDGDGPWYFYSWLHSVQQVLKAALLFRQHVLHTTDIFDQPKR